MEKFKCILLIDDDEVNNFLTEVTIKTEGLAVKVEVALNGVDGLIKLKELHKDKDTPELILLDLTMPVMDGYGFLQEFGELDLENKPKVVVLTSSRNSKDIGRVKDFGNIGLINKPFSVNDLKTVLKQY